MPALTDPGYELRRAQEDFELLMRRPPNSFRLSAERQWEIDKLLGALDAFCEQRYITDEMRQRWKDHFGRKL